MIADDGVVADRPDGAERSKASTTGADGYR